MENLSIPIAQYVNQHGQARVAKLLGVSQVAVHKILKNGNRQIFIEELPNGELKAFEIRKFPHKTQEELADQQIQD